MVIISTSAVETSIQAVSPESILGAVAWAKAFRGAPMAAAARAKLKNLRSPLRCITVVVLLIEGLSG